jgi:hypothetical protein
MARGGTVMDNPQFPLDPPPKIRSAANTLETTPTETNKWTIELTNFIPPRVRLTHCQGLTKELEAPEVVGFQPDGSYRIRVQLVFAKGEIRVISI